MQQGTVKFFNESKGFGFITPSAGGADVFVHVSGLKSEIRENDTVSYEVQNGQKGLNAVNVIKPPKHSVQNFQTFRPFPDKNEKTHVFHS